MSQPDPDRLSQDQDNLIRDTTVSGDLTFAPVQIGTKIETLIIEASPEQVIRQVLNPRSPYQGLKRFNFADRDRFFGRDRLIATLLAAVNQNSLNLVLGASGSGKSSVVRAGLIPELKKSLRSQTFYDFIFTPDQDPFESLYRCLLNGEKDYHFKKSEAEMALAAQPDTLATVIKRLKQAGDRWLIFIDQFEELFTTCDDSAKRKNFIAGLGQLARSTDQSVKVVLAMRSDFLEQFSFYPDLGAIANDANQKNLHLVTEMYPAELRQAIEQPAAKHGVVFEEGLVQQIIEEVEGQKGYLPLLQYTLNLLWEEECQTSIESRTLTKQSYATLGGVRGALQKRIDAIYEALSPDEKRDTEQIFLRLVNLVDTDSSSRKAVSRRAYRHEFTGESIEKLLDKLIEENLLVSNIEYSSLGDINIRDTQKLKQTATIEIAHEILLSSWDSLSQWIDEERESIIFRNWLTGETRRWLKVRSENPNQAQDELLKGSHLAQADSFRKREVGKGLGDLSPDENEFIDTSLRWQERSRKLQIRTAWSITASSLVAVLVSSSLGFMAWSQSKQAELNLAESLSSSSLSSLKGGQELNAYVQGVKAGKILRKHHVYNSNVIAALQRTLNDGSEYNVLRGHTDSVFSVSFSPDSKTLATGSADKTIKLWNVETGQEIRTLQSHTDSVFSVSFSPDSKTLATGSWDKTIKLWNVETGQEIRTLQGHTDLVFSVGFSPNGKTLATSSTDKTIKLWNVETGQETRTLQGHANSVLDVSFSPDGKTLATSSWDKTIKLWNVETGQEIQTLQGHTSRVYSVSFSPDSKTLATGSWDKTIKLWNVETGQEIRTLQGHTDRVYSVGFSLDGKTLATGSADNIVKLWNVETGQEIRTLQGHTDRVLSVSFSPDGKTLATGSLDKTIKLWNVETGREIRTLQGHTDRVLSVSFSPDDKTLATGGFDNTAKLWNVKTGREIRTLQGHTDRVYSVSFGPNGKTLATGSADKTIKLWNVETGQEIRTLQGHTDRVYSVGFSLDGKTLATGSADKTIKLWNVETGEEIKTLQGHIDSVFSVGFRLDGKTLATGSADKTIKLWNVETGEEIKTLQGHTDRVYSVGFRLDGKTLATGSADKTIKLWNVETGEEIKTLQGHTDSVYSVSFSPDGKTLATGSADKTIKLWNVETGKEIRTLQGHTDSIFSVSFRLDSKTLATGSADKTIKLWNVVFWTLSLDTLLEKNCDWIRNYLANLADNDPDKRVCDGIGTSR